MAPIIEESFPQSILSGKTQEIQESTDEVNSDMQKQYDELKDFQKLAIEMRINLIPYKKIVEAIKSMFGKEYQEQSIRNWFDKNGRCSEPFKYMDKIRSEQNVRELEAAVAKLKAQALNAIGMLGDGLINDNLSDNQVKIAQDILDRSGFPKITKTDNNHQVDIKESKIFTDALVKLANTTK